jgi:hypothetical protein
MVLLATLGEKLVKKLIVEIYEFSRISRFLGRIPCLKKKK